MHLINIDSIYMTEVKEEMNKLIETQGRIETANEMDENTQAIYRNDLMYLFFKVLMFVVLGVVFYFLLKDQSPTEILSQMKEKASVASKVVRDKLSPAKDIVKV